jgi:hypothetical protein
VSPTRVCVNDKRREALCHIFLGSQSQIHSIQMAGATYRNTSNIDKLIFRDFLFLFTTMRRISWMAMGAVECAHLNAIHP